MANAELLYKDFITALVFLRNIHDRYGEPVDLEYFKTQVRSRPVLIRLAKEALCNIYPEYYWNEELSKHVPAIEISWKGLFKVYLEVPPKYSDS